VTEGRDSDMTDCFAVTFTYTKVWSLHCSESVIVQIWELLYWMGVITTKPDSFLRILFQKLLIKSELTASSIVVLSIPWFIHNFLLQKVKMSLALLVFAITLYQNLFKSSDIYIYMCVCVCDKCVTFFKISCNLKCLYLKNRPFILHGALGILMPMLNSLK